MWLPIIEPAVGLVRAATAFILLLVNGGGYARSQPHDHSQHGGATAVNGAGQFLMSQSSGTAVQPSAWPMPMVMSQAGDWHFMWMGQAYLVATQQSGPRGGDKLYSTNWGMLSAARSLGRGALQFRGMVTLEPLTVTKRRYPLLFQTGEGAYGRPIVDGQHPHELLMELSAQYAHPVGTRAMAHVYYAPVGDAALGPVAFPHRASAMELPQATLAHHWQDATHIANNVLTAGFSWDRLRIEASGFHGREPDENRWNVDMGGMDSWSGRLWLQIKPTWTAQFSAGRLHRPEAFHADDVVRGTASLHHVRRTGGANAWATSVIWARNYKTIAKAATHAVVAETVIPVSSRNLISGRFEWSQRDELFEYDHDLAHEIEERTGRRAFPVTALTAGYTRDIAIPGNVQAGIGANVTAYATDRVLRPFYGAHPWGMNVFLRLRVRAAE